MITMDMGPWADAVKKHLTENKALVDEASSRAAGRLAYQAVQDIRAQMKVTFANPTSWTLNSVTHVEKSTKAKYLQSMVPTDGSALVIFKETEPGAKQIGAGRYLYPQVVGGPRRQTRMERRLQMINPTGQTLYLLPTENAEYDGSGNLNPGWVVAVLSAVQALSGAGFNGNRRIGRNSKRAAAIYSGRRIFVIWPGSKNYLRPGIYQERALNAGVEAVFRFSRTPPTYRPRFDPVRITQFTIQRYAAEFFFRALRRQLPPTPSSGT